MIAALTLVVALLAGPALTPRLQNPVNPTTIEFTPSVDHAVAENGQSVVGSYLVELYTPTGTQAVASRDIGKPTPANNLITYTQLKTMYATLPVGNYVAKVAAVGPGGTTFGSASSPFSVTLRAPAAPPGSPIIR
jgi:hypothetical protein